MFQRFFDEGLAQASFLIGCDRTGHAVVIDPRRDAGIYLSAAQQHGVTIAAAIETHVHADFVSGARELAAAGVRVLTGPRSGTAFEHEEPADGERVAFGDLALTFLHTPGHTPEHITIAAEQPGGPARLFTGDLLFVGAVGRPDLLGEAQTRQLAHQLYHSLRRLMAFDDEVEVHPGHGSGSLCGAGIGKAPSSTIGRERRQNPLLGHTDEHAFVRAVLADLPETPSYFPRMKRINQQGPPLLDLIDRPRHPPLIRPAAAGALIADGALVVDLRDPAEFAAAHPAGALNIPFGSKVGYWGGWVIPGDAPVILLAADALEANEAAVQLLRVGIDRIEGAINGGFAAWRASSLPEESFDIVAASVLRRALEAHEPWLVLDVRSAREWESDRIEGSINIPVGELPTRAADVPREGTVAVLCEGGYRSSLAASLLAREGIRPTNVDGGMAAYRAMEVA